MTTLGDQRQAKPDLVEAVARAIDDAMAEPYDARRVATAALASTGIPVDTLAALSEGRMVAMPSPDHMTDDMAEAIAIPGRCCGGTALDIYYELVRLGSVPQTKGAE